MTEAPTMPRTVRVGRAKFQRAVRAVTVAASPDPDRPIITGVHIWVNADKLLVLEATDSYRLHRVTLPTPELWSPGFEAIVPASWLARWAKLRAPGAALPGTTVDLIAGDTTITLIDPVREETSTCRAIAGEYPNASKLIDEVPDEGGAQPEIAVNPKYFAELLDAAVKFADDYRHLRVVRFHPLRTCLFTVADRDGKLDLAIMPVRAL